tara:strand:+ start:56 stop:1213 length:1158 start_codon:yes stop_codon:yes gene_type:complete
MLDSFKNIPIYSGYDFNKPLPLLTKQEINQNFPLNWQTKAIKEKIVKGDVEWLTTSGTSSERLQLMRPKQWRQEQIEKSYAYHPLLNKLWQQGLKRAVLTTAVCSQMVCFKKGTSTEHRWVDRSLYINLHHNPNQWQKQDLERMLFEINQIGNYIFDADPYYLALFLKQLHENNILSKLNKPQCITLGYELCTENLHQYIKELLDVTIVDIYGSTELGYLLYSDDRMKMSSCSEKTEFELLSINDKTHLYELIVTSDKNSYMPLLRYRTGDCVDALNLDGQVIINRMMGRVSEFFVTTFTKRKVTERDLDDVIYQITRDVLIHQIMRIDEQKITFHYVSIDNNQLTEKLEQEISEELTRFLEVLVDVSHQCEINPAHSGKFSWIK